MLRLDHPFGVRHHAQHIALGVEYAGDVARRSVDVLIVAERDLAFALDPVERRGIGEIVAVMMRHRNADRLALRGTERRVNRLEVFSTVSSTVWQTKRMPALRISAPGSSPASVRIWKPLQMPSTATPRSAAAITAPTTGERAAIAPERR